MGVGEVADHSHGDADGTGGDDFVTTFTVAAAGGESIESPSNNSLGAADPLDMFESPSGSGYTRGIGLGAVQVAGDVDYWSFDALAGDRVFVGIGRGDSALAHLGRAPASVSHLERYVQAVRGYLAGEEVPFDALGFSESSAPDVATLGMADTPNASRLVFRRRMAMPTAARHL